MDISTHVSLKRCARILIEFDILFFCRVSLPDWFMIEIIRVLPRLINTHAYLLPKGNKLPFHPKGKVFYFE